MDALPEGVDSKFRFVLLVAKRAEQLVEGAMPKVKARNAKAARTAMREIQQGLVKWQTTPPVDELAEMEIPAEEP